MTTEKDHVFAAKNNHEFTVRKATKFLKKTCVDRCEFQEIEINLNYDYSVCSLQHDTMAQ